jgi:mannose-6-phosphate isomerase-like protein (cupin superfamily)
MNGKIVVLQPAINKTTITDGRGAILSFIPSAPVLEFVYQVTNAGSSRGYHYHPEFDEYVLFTEGEGVYIEQLDDGTDRFITIGPGVCVYIPSGVYHTFNAITLMKSVSLLTKPWDSCENPIILKKDNV